ncbi:hypothetical protein Ocin01_18840 [Orchesella cincta]|uniref:Uncharacterized protein n=1 Tax=Orchesella cincta TaxID=48709 RepID=A0A1D2M4D9_ORCCI|nr:hypothetical protein Ocin01_18840 [Orchesella cincta]
MAIDGSTFNIYHEKFYKRLLRDDFNGYWTPVILTSDESETSALYLVAAKHSHSEIAWECINIWGNGSDIQNYDVHFSIKNDKISSQRMQRDRSPFSIYEFVNTVQNVQSAHVFENVSSTIHPFDTWIKESDKKAFKKTKPFTFSLRGLSRNARAYEESLILCIEIRIQGGSTHHSNIRSNLVDCKDLWTFFHPNIQDDETKEVAAKLQKARICQKQSQLKLKKQNEAIVAKLKQLELQHNEIKSSILESERKLDEEHRQKKSERLKYIRHQKLNLENQIKEKQKQITLRENEMLERHMLERQKLNEEKLAIQKEREFIFTTFEKDTLQKTTLNQHMVEKNELKQKHISMESHMIEEIKLLSDQLLEKENEGKEIVKKQRQIEMQIGILEGQMLCDQWLDTQILQKKKQIDAQKKELEEQMMGRNNEMLARLTLEKQRLESEKQKQWTRMKSEINQL